MPIKRKGDNTNNEASGGHDSSAGVDAAETASTATNDSTTTTTRTKRARKETAEPETTTITKVDSHIIIFNTCIIDFYIR